MITDYELKEKFTESLILNIYNEYFELRPTAYSNKQKLKINNYLTRKSFEKNLMQNIRCIVKKVINGNYFFKNFIEIKIPKPNSLKFREINIPNIEDFLVQKGLHAIIFPYIETKCSITNFNYGFRRKKTYRNAISKIYNSIQNGYTEVISTDIISFGKTIDHDSLKKIINQNFDKKSIISKLLLRYIATGSLFENVFIKRTIGLPEGGCLTSDLENLYLNELDNYIANFLDNHSCFVRYVDDIVILSKDRETLISIFDKMKFFLNNELKLSVYEKIKFKMVNLLTPYEYIKFANFNISKKCISLNNTKIKKFKLRIINLINDKEKNNSLNEIVDNINISMAKNKNLIDEIEAKQFRAIIDILFINNLSLIKGLDTWMSRTVRNYCINKFGYSTDLNYLDNLMSLKNAYYEYHNRF